MMTNMIEVQFCTQIRNNTSKIINSTRKIVKIEKIHYQCFIFILY